MLALLSAAILVQPNFRPLGDCILKRPVEFSEDMKTVPADIRSDIKQRVGLIYPPTEKNVDLSDMGGPHSKVGSVLIYVAHHEKQWLISYRYGGVAIRTVTVSYLESQSRVSTKPYLIGALEGDGCIAANAFLEGINVEWGWQR